ncbi:MAG: hypothetical protein IPK35_24175 [Saprospiraceae bacterium]|nr:hypothetical protein [Saprospiraceae bacterium]
MKTNFTHQRSWVANSGALLIICPLIIIIFLNGCSITSMLVGSKMKTRGDILVSGGEIHKIGRDKKVMIILKTADTLQGVFKGTDLVPLDEYTALYLEKCSKLLLDFDMPYPGEDISFKIIKSNTAIQSKNITYSYIFEGFDQNKAILKDNKNNIKMCLLNNIDSPNTSFSKINDLIVSGEIPTRTILIIETLQGLQKINTFDIQYIKFQDPKNYSQRGLLIGLGVDLYLIWLIYTSLSQLTL